MSDRDYTRLRQERIPQSCYFSTSPSGVRYSIGPKLSALSGASILLRSPTQSRNIWSGWMSWRAASETSAGVSASSFAGSLL